MQATYWISLAMCLAPAFCFPQKPLPCRSPPLYTGGMTVGTQNDQLWAVGMYAYDGINQRIHVGEIGTYNNKSFTYNALMLFNEEVLYEINDKDKTCVKKALKSDFHPMEVPKGAAFVSQVVLGTSSGPGQGLLVNSWWGDMPDKSGNYMLSFTEFGCLPVSSLVKTKNMGWMSVSYYNNMLGVDPNVFIPPPFCKDAKLEVGEKVDFFSIFH
ncbi:ependymin-like [Sardina pilchardus]|uniref:ependymin-like n=1 Tax=Sardina pilchardus TaxID=27697 RepID=UPI002E15FA84